MKIKTKFIQTGALFVAFFIPINPALALEALERSQATERVINGEVVDGVFRRVPWIFSLRKDDKHACAASFISPTFRNQKITKWSSEALSPRWAITAAHCVVDREGNPLDPSRLAIWGGTTDISINTDDSNSEIQVVQKIFLPGEETETGIGTFNKRTLENDIALLQLSDSNVDLSSNKRQSIRFPSLREVGWAYEPYTAVYTAGWGRTEALLASKKLMEVRLPLVEKTLCQSKYERYGDQISAGMICAGFVSGEYDACQGDSGGPLYYRPSDSHGRTSSPILLGIVSWGRGCGSSDLFGVYSSIAFYERWVKRTIEDQLI